MVYWTTPPGYRDYGTFVGSFGRMKDIETTALAAIAYMRAGFGTSLEKIMNYLVKAKDAFGTWGST